MGAKRRFEFDMTHYLNALRILKADTQAACRAAVYAGAGVMADAIRKGIDGLRVVSDAHAKNAYALRTPTLISYTQREGLRKSLGVAPIKGNHGGIAVDIVDTRISFDGYNDVITDEHPHGEPNALIAASCNKGTPGMLEQPFIDRAIKQSKNAAAAAIAQTFKNEIYKLIGGK